MSSNSSQPEEYEVSDLLREIEVLREENAILREGFTRLYGAIARQYSARGRDERANVEKYARTVEGMEPDDRPGYLASMGEGMIEALAEKSPALVTEGPDLLHYDIRNLNDRRRDAILSYMEKTGKSSITTQEARHVLQTAEGRQLDRKAVWRALIAARGVLGATTDILGGVLRLIVPSSPRPGDQRHVAAGGGGERDTSPRSRRWSVPWDGED